MVILIWYISTININYIMIYYVVIIHYYYSHNS